MKPKIQPKQTTLAFTEKLNRTHKADKNQSNIVNT